MMVVVVVIVEGGGGVKPLTFSFYDLPSGYACSVVVVVVLILVLIISQHFPLLLLLFPPLTTGLKEDQVLEVNLPNGYPIAYHIDDDTMRPTGPRVILGDKRDIEAAIHAVANENKK